MSIDNLSPVQREEMAVDLRKQLAELNSVAPAEWEFRTVPSPMRTPSTLYSLIDGEKISVPLYIARQAMQTGRWTTNPANAPVYVQGSTRCFLHPDSPERETLNGLGMAGKVCAAAKLANEFARDIHAQRKHRQEWAALQNHYASLERQEDRDLQRQQVEATLDLARAAAGEKATKKVSGG